MRRVVLTPTFAAGLGVVVAAVLAYPMRTMFLYASPNGSTCEVVSCGTQSQTGGEPASGPTHRLTSPGRPGTHSGGNGARSGVRHTPAGGGGGGQTLAAGPQLSYQTSRKADWGFDGTIVMAFEPKFAHQQWRLQFTYPAGRILEASAGGYVHIRHGRHTAVASWDSPAHATFPRLVRVSIEVAGRPGPPRRCTFNGHGCHFGPQPGQRGSPGGQSHQSNDGTKPAGDHKPGHRRGRRQANAAG